MPPHSPAARRSASRRPDEIERSPPKFYTANVGDKVTDPPTFETNVEAGTITLRPSSTYRPPSSASSASTRSSSICQSQVTLGSGTARGRPRPRHLGFDVGKEDLDLEDGGDQTSSPRSTISPRPAPSPIRSSSVVPFSGAVNVGPGYKNDRVDGHRPASAPTIAEPWRPRRRAEHQQLQPVQRLKDSSGAVTWGGCVEERPIPYDARRRDADAARPSPRIFVPMVAAGRARQLDLLDEHLPLPARRSSRVYNGAPTGSQSYNNYLPDAGQPRRRQQHCQRRTNGAANCKVQQRQEQAIAAHPAHLQIHRRHADRRR